MVATTSGGREGGPGPAGGRRPRGRGTASSARPWPSVTGGRGCDVVYDGVGQATFDDGLAVAAPARHDGAVRRGQRPGAADRPAAAELRRLAVPDPAHPGAATSPTGTSCSGGPATCSAGWPRACSTSGSAARTRWPRRPGPRRTWRRAAPPASCSCCRDRRPCGRLLPFPVSRRRPPPPFPASRPAGRFGSLLPPPTANLPPAGRPCRASRPLVGHRAAPRARPRRRSLAAALLVVSIVALAFNLRAAITSLPPIFPELETTAGPVLGHGDACWPRPRCCASARSPGWPRG